MLIEEVSPRSIIRHYRFKYFITAPPRCQAKNKKRCLFFQKNPPFSAVFLAFIPFWNFNRGKLAGFSRAEDRKEPAARIAPSSGYFHFQKLNTRRRVRKVSPHSLHLCAPFEFSILNFQFVVALLQDTSPSIFWNAFTAKVLPVVFSVTQVVGAFTVFSAVSLPVLALTAYTR